LPFLAAAPNHFFYYSSTSKTNYSLSTFLEDASAQEVYCNSIGGHLASYDNATEQNEVERYFIKQVIPRGLGGAEHWLPAAVRHTRLSSALHALCRLQLIPRACVCLQSLFAPAYHQRYRLGLTYDTSSSTWGWLDISNAEPLAPDYVNWSGGEPNVAAGSCAIANFSLGAYTPTGVAEWQATGCEALHPCMCKTRPPGSVPPQNYTASNNVTYSFSTALLPMSSAQAFCNSMGGHLVSFESESLQIEVSRMQSMSGMEHSCCHNSCRSRAHRPGYQAPACAPAPTQVEDYFSSIGILLPGWHKSYWTALHTKSTSDPHVWSLMDPFPAPFSAESYSHWGDAQPDNTMPPESCVAASYELRYQSGTPGLGAWGWEDQPCSTRNLVLCRIIRGWLLPEHFAAAPGAGSPCLPDDFVLTMRIGSIRCAGCCTRPISSHDRWVSPACSGGCGPRRRQGRCPSNLAAAPGQWRLPNCAHEVEL
jgi:hypothetical protein